MIISVINMSDGALIDSDLQAGIRAVNRQLTYDFAPYWGFGGQLRVEGKTGKRQGFDQADMRGDAVLYVRERKGANDDGFHTTHFAGIPYGFVYLDVAETLDEEWSVTLSHEALELVGDPELNLLVKGPHPDPNQDREVFHWFEMCDAVQDESYIIDGRKVSNFVLPLYFTSGHERGGRNDFLGTLTDGKTLRSFKANPGGYIMYFDPKTGEQPWESPHSARSKERLDLKRSLGIGRGHRRRLSGGAGDRGLTWRRSRRNIQVRTGGSLDDASASMRVLGLRSPPGVAMPGAARTATTR
jgi:hypothetical protein